MDIDVPLAENLRLLIISAGHYIESLRYTGGKDLTDTICNHLPRLLNTVLHS